MTKLKTLEAKNVKGLKELAIDFQQHGNLVVVGGPNGAGKSTALDSVMYLFGGRVPKDVLRHGTKHGEIEAELDSGIIARRVITEKGMRLVVKNDQGMVFSSPQAVLKKLVQAANGRSTLGFDPLEFARMSPKKQRDTLQELVGLDFTDLDKEKERLLEERRDALREEQTLASEIEDLEPLDDDGLPETEIAIADLLEERERRAAKNMANDRARMELTQTVETHKRYEEEIKDLEAKLRSLRESIAVIEKKEKALREEASRLQDEDVAEIDEKLRTVEATNRLVRERNRRQAIMTAHADAAERAKMVSEELQDLEEKKKRALAEAEMPIPGLAFDEDGVTLNGVRMEALSGAERLMVSVGMAIAMQPELKVLLIRDGSLLDSENLEALRDIADRNDVTILLERVGAGPEVTIELQEGEMVVAERRDDEVHL